MPAGSFDFDHDGVGNRLNRTVDSTDVTGYNYSVGTNRLSQSTGATAASYGYDNSGNIATDSTDTTAYTLTDDQRLASVTKNGVTAGAYQYNARGLRTVKTVNGETTLFIYCKSGRLIVEADSDGNITKEYVYLEGEIFAHFPAVTSTPSDTAFLQAVYFLLLLQNNPDEGGDNPAEGDILAESGSYPC